MTRDPMITKVGDVCAAVIPPEHAGTWVLRDSLGGYFFGFQAGTGMPCFVRQFNADVALLNEELARRISRLIAFVPHTVVNMAAA